MSKDLITSTYSWEAPSQIVRIEVERLPGDMVRYRLVPAEGVEQGALAAVPDALNRAGFTNIYPEVHNGQNVLMVSGGNGANELIRVLSELGMVQNGPNHMRKATLQPGQGGVVNQALSNVQGDTLKWSGRIGLIGHAAILASGIMRKKPDLAFGSLGALNPIILSIYGNGKGEINFENMMDKMRGYFAAEGVDLPKEDYHREQISLLKGIDSLLAQYPLQIGHALGSIGAFSLMKAGWSEMKGGNKKALGLLLASTTSLLGNGAVIFVPEKKKDKDEDTSVVEQLKYGVKHAPQGLAYAATNPTKVPRKLWDFIQDSPLRFNGLLNISDNLLWFVHALGEREMQQKYLLENGGKIAELKTEMNGMLDALTKARAEGQPVGQSVKNISKLEDSIATLQKDQKFASSRMGRFAPYLMFTTAFSFGIATFLSAISSKNRDSAFLQDERYEQMYASAAKLLVQLPAQERSDVLTRMSVFLSTQEEVKDGKISAERIMGEVSERLDAMECSPWFAVAEFNRERDCGAQMSV